MEFILDLDRKLLLWLNSIRSPWLDPVMFLFSETFFWLPLYLFLIFLIFKNYKKDAWFLLLGAAITILLADQTTNFMKNYFQRLRPSHEPTLEGIIHLTKDFLRGGIYKGGLYSFSSGHAANTLGTALFVWLALRPFYKWISWIFLWAALMTYTRIYLGVHYPGDILVGGMIGLCSGWIGFRISRWLIERKKTTSA